ncbi:1-phosphofructokinase [Janibacter sp. G349]|uniref:1-phosphofructokinase n=1 Tax=Janibacter sp. G349 TaxID=3405424 RepID=UPI003B7983BB
MIITLTPNPSIDRTVDLAALRRGQVNRATASRIDPGGKGVNVSRALTAQGSPTLAVLPEGGPEGHLMAELLDAAGVRRRGVPVAGSVRLNVTAVEPDGTTTKLNEPGPTLDKVEVRALLEAVADAVRSAGGEPVWVVGCGSLPPGAPADLLAGLVTAGRRAGARVAVDSSGDPLRPAVAAGPDLIKPNRVELEELVGADLPTLGAVVDAARDLVAGGVGRVAVSLGRDGAVLVDGDEVVHARATIARPVSTVGAGDCMLAGLLHDLAAGAPAAQALCTGVRWGAAAVTLPGSSVPTPPDLADIDVSVTTTPDRSLAVRD